MESHVGEGPVSWRVGSHVVAVALAFICAVVVAVSVLLALPAESDAQEENSGAFDRVGTFEVPGGGVAEIVNATPDGKTLAYTDSESEAVGFVDLSDPAAPKPIGDQVDVGGEPTSVGISPDGSLALAAVQTSNLEEGKPPELKPGKLVAINIASNKVVGSVDLGPGPDAVKVSQIGGKLVAVVAVENEPVIVDQAGNLTDEEAPGNPMDQSAPGLIQIVTVNPDDITASKVTDINLDLSGTGLLYPKDPQPENVDISSGGRAAVSLQENNGLVTFDVAAAISGQPQVTISNLGVVANRPADLTSDGKVSLTQTYPTDALKDEPNAGTRQPDAIAWGPGNSLVYTANEGEVELTGGRDFSAFSPDGKLLFDDGGQLTEAAVERGFYPEDSAADKGLEVQGVETGMYGGTDYLFVASQPGAFVAVYQIATPTSPELDGFLPTGASTEGLLAIPDRSLFVAANEGGDNEGGSISIFGATANAGYGDLVETGGPSPSVLAAGAAGLFLVIATLLAAVALCVRSARRA